MEYATFEDDFYLLFSESHGHHGSYEYTGLISHGFPIIIPLTCPIIIPFFPNEIPYKSHHNPIGIPLTNHDYTIQTQGTYF